MFQKSARKIRSNGAPKAVDDFFGALAFGVALSAAMFVGSATARAEEAPAAAPAPTPAASPATPVLHDAPNLQPLTVPAGWKGVAPCLASSPEALDQPLRSAAADAATEDATVAGVRLKNQPAALVEALRAVARATPPQGSAPGGCEDVLCAADAMYGAEVGRRLLTLATYHFEAAALSVGEPTALAAELDVVLSAFADLPPSIFPLGGREHRTLSRGRGGEGRAAALGSASGVVVAIAGEGARGIELRDGWDELAPNAQRVAIVHEIAHEFIRARGRSLDWRTAWRKALAADQAAAGDPTLAFVSLYAETNLEEDFAESFAAYRYAAPALKRRGPHRYALLRDWAFSGVEYGSAAACRAAGARRGV